MIFATIDNGTPDGELVLVSQDRSRMLSVDTADTAPNLLAAITDWDRLEPLLHALAEDVEAGEGVPLARDRLLAPLPRSWQWLDGSAFSTHGELMQVAYGHDPLETARPLMYQGMSDRFLAPTQDAPFRSEADGIDFEGEFGVIVDAVPMGTSPADALEHIRLIVQINDWSLRAIAMTEMKTGFGWVQAKPPCSMAPFAIAPAMLGDSWQNGRVCLDLAIDWNGRRVGNANGGPMAFGFHDLVAHAAATRDLVAGTIIGSGTVSNPDYTDVGSSCISEIQAIEMIRAGSPETGFMQFGDTIRMEARDASGIAPFGTIEQRVVKSPGPIL